MWSPPFGHTASGREGAPEAGKDVLTIAESAHLARFSTTHPMTSTYPRTSAGARIAIRHATIMPSRPDTVPASFRLQLARTIQKSDTRLPPRFAYAPASKNAALRAIFTSNDHAPGRALRSQLLQAPIARRPHPHFGAARHRAGGLRKRPNGRRRSAQTIAPSRSSPPSSWQS